MPIVVIKEIFLVLGTSPGTYGSNEPANSAQLIRATDLSPPVISSALPLYKRSNDSQEDLSDCIRPLARK